MTSPLKNPTLRLDLICAALLFALAFVFFSPLVGGKKQLPQSDIVQAAGMQQDVREYRVRTGDEPYWSESMFSGMPAITISVHYFNNVMHYVWPLLGLGLPYPIGILFWGMLLSFVLLRTWGVQPLLAAAGGVAYGFFSFHIAWIEAGHINKVQSLMMAPGVLVALSLAYGATSWARRLTATALMVALLGMQIYFNHIQMTYYLMIVAGLLVVAEVWRAWREGRLRQALITSGVMGAAAAIALLINAAPIYPMQQYAKYTIRGASELAQGNDAARQGGLDRDYAYAWSYGRDEMMTLLVPNTMGGASNGSLAELGKSSATLAALRSYNVDANSYVRQMPSYWGEQSFTAGPIYVGAVVAFCFVLGLILVDGAVKWALLYAVLLGVLLSLGQFAFTVPVSLLLLAVPAAVPFVAKRLPKVPAPLLGAVLFGAAWMLALTIDPDPSSSYRLSDLLMDYLPLYDKFRVPSSMLVIVAMAAPWLGFLGTQALLDPARDAGERQRGALWAGGLVAGLCALFYLFGGELLSFSSAGDARYQLPQPLLDALVEDRRALMQADAGRSFFFVAVAAGLAWFAARQSINAVVFGALLLALTALDLVGVARRFVNSETFVPTRTYKANFEPAEADLLIGQDSSYFRVFPLGRNPFNDGRTPYHLHSVGGYNAAKLRRYQQLIEAHLSKGVANVVNMLNTKYLITREPLSNPAYPLVKQSADGEYVYRNGQNYGPAWMVQSVAVAPSPDAALDTLDAVNSLELAVVEAPDQPSVGGVSAEPVDRATETVTLTAHDNRLRRYTTQSPHVRFVTFSEVFYPQGWTATIDGQPAPIIRTNFVLRGLVVPAGTHTIEFRYEDPTVTAAERASLIGSILLGLLVVAAVGLELRAARAKAQAA